MSIKDFDSKIQDLKVTYVNVFNAMDEYGIILKWECPSIGYGEYTLIYNEETEQWTGESEAMDNNIDKKLLSVLLDKFKDMIHIVS